MSIFDAVKQKIDSVRGSELERKVKDATSNENWGASGSLKKEIAQATFDYQGYREVMPLLWKRLSESGKNWRIVFKALQLLEELIRSGSERVVEEARERMFSIRTLGDFQAIDEQGRDKGAGIREMSKKLCDVLNDNDKIKEARADARKHGDKFKSSISNEGATSGGNRSFSSNDNYGGESRGGRYDPDTRYSDNTEETIPEWNEEGEGRPAKKDKKKSTGSGSNKKGEGEKATKSKKKVVVQEEEPEEPVEEEEGEPSAPEEEEESEPAPKAKGFKIKLNDKPAKSTKAVVPKLGALGKDKKAARHQAAESEEPVDLVSIPAVVSAPKGRVAPKQAEPNLFSGNNGDDNLFASYPSQPARQQQSRPAAAQQQQQQQQQQHSGGGSWAAFEPSSGSGNNAIGDDDFFGAVTSAPARVTNNNNNNGAGWGQPQQQQQQQQQQHSAAGGLDDFTDFIASAPSAAAGSGLRIAQKKEQKPADDEFDTFQGAPKKDSKKTGDACWDSGLIDLGALDLEGKKQRAQADKQRELAEKYRSQAASRPAAPSADPSLYGFEGGLRGGGAANQAATGPKAGAKFDAFAGLLGPSVPAPGPAAPPPAAGYYGAPPAGGRGGPVPGYGAPAPGYGVPQPGYGAPQGYGYGAPPAPGYGYGAPQPGYPGPPPGYGYPPPQPQPFRF